MIDIHSHILPEFDDGSDSIQTSIMMSAISADEGFRTVIATPHVLWDGHYSRSLTDKIRRLTSETQQAISSSNIPIKLISGAEVMMVDIAEEQIKEGKFPTLGDTDYVLVEFSFTISFEDLLLHLNALKSNDLKPIIAHPERYIVLQKHKKLLKTLAQEGYYLQINKDSILGLFGHKAYSAAKWALQHNVVALVATDSHNADSRTPHIRDAHEFIEKKFGREYLELITKKNQELLLQNKPMIVNIK